MTLFKAGYKLLSKIIRYQGFQPGVSEYSHKKDTRCLFVCPASYIADGFKITFARNRLPIERFTGSC
jgi:hypothetical protein